MARSKNRRTFKDDLTPEELALFDSGPTNWGDEKETAARGAVYLDRIDPGWEKHVEVLELNLQSTCNCVLGQLFREDEADYSAFYRAKRQLGLQAPDDTDYDDAVSASVFLGFDATLKFGDFGANPAYGRLTDAWTVEIDSRKPSSSDLR